MTRKSIFGSAFLLSAIFVPLIAKTQTQKQAPATKAKPASAANGAQHENDGQRVFEQNCSRCHTAPDGFSQRISGTIVRHMRVRASLSEKDEQALLRFFNP
jgi:hypothetical protein